jgi:uncharacterized protein YndB with AHSA1/START domain
VLVRAHRVVAAEPETVWRLVGDPNQLPRWWPRTVRVEGVTGREFTVVMTSSRGREVRADQRVVANDRGRRRVWALEVEGSPFATVFAGSETTVLLAPADGGTEVRLELRQKLRGAARLGALLVRRGSRRQLREALDGVAAALEPAPAP